MSRVLVVGLGEVGVRAARQLLDTPGVDRVLVSARSTEHARAVARALHDGAEAVAFDRESDLPPDVDVIAAATPGTAAVRLARKAVTAGVSIASPADRVGALAALTDFDGDARRAGVRVVAGCGLAPGLSDVLARHAADALDTVDELHVARWGVAGEARLDDARASSRERAAEWREGVLLDDVGHGQELVWFPDPVGARECELVATGVEALVAANPGVRRATVRLGVPRVPKVHLPGRHDPGEGWGAVRVEAWGDRGGVRGNVVYGVIERTAVAAGTVLGVISAWLAGALPDLGRLPEPGTTGLGGVVDPVAFLSELARRGVKAAAFEGVQVG